MYFYEKDAEENAEGLRGGPEIFPQDRRLHYDKLIAFSSACPWNSPVEMQQNATLSSPRSAASSRQER